MLVFLDLDGVLRRDFSAPGALEPCCLDPFCDTIRAIPAARIVISSGWRIGLSLDEIRSQFPPDVAERIVGMTPVLATDQEQGRHSEVLAYLGSQTNPHERWVAIDDDPHHFRPDCGELILVDPAKGFDDAASADLLRRAG